MANPDAAACPYCGARINDGLTCEDRFHALGILEITFPEEAYAGHFYMVANYMLQHNVYSDEARPGMISMLAGAVEQGKTPADLRRENRDRLDSGHRKFKIAHKNPPIPNPPIPWKMTVADIDPDDPTVYIQSVIAWSKSILATVRENPVKFGKVEPYKP